MSALAQVDENEDWYAWLLYFLKGMEIQARLSLRIALEIDSLFKMSRSKIQAERANLNLIKVLEQMFIRPYTTSAILSKETEIPRTTCERYLQILADKGVIEDLGIQKRQRVYVNSNLWNLLRNI